MNESKQKRILLIIIATLSLANTITLLLLFMNRPGHKKDVSGSRKSNMAAYLKKDVGFSEAQIASFDSLHNDHMKSVDGMFNEMRLEKERRFKYLAAEDFNDSTIEIAGSVMSEKQKALEIKMLRYLRKVRSIGTPEQQAKFDTTFIRFMNHEKEKKKMKH